MTEPPDIHSRLASALREARRARGLSLDAAAKLSGVSRSMVSQIERGESSPTVATLWSLTRALQLDFAGLLEPRDTPAIEVIRAQSAPTIAGHGTGVRIRILSPPESVGSHEVYELGFDAGGRLVSEPHRPGAREHLTVIDGSLTVASGPDRDQLAAGDTARYAADRPHRIEAGAAPARALLIVQNG